MKDSPYRVAVIGSGPAALMAADVISSAGVSVTLFEKRSSPGRKLLIAGSSGLNITHDTPLEEFHRKYSGSSEFWKNLFSQFPPQDWINFIENLGIKTFKGTSHRYFIEEMKAPKLLSVWKDRLTEKGVNWQFNKYCTHFQKGPTGEINLSFNDSTHFTFRAVVFCLGGASWEPPSEPVQWPRIFIRKKIGFTPFTASNCGFSVELSSEFFKEAEGLPLKNIVLTSSKGKMQGDLVVTSYGLEGTPIYALGSEETVYLDLKPDLTEDQMIEKLNRSKENLNPIRRIKKYLKLSPASLALLFHQGSKEDLQDLKTTVARLKHFPITLKKRQGLEWAISSAGGLKLDELTPNLELKKFPGVFAAGEMLDWDTATGGFLIQACVSQGFCAGKGVISFLKTLRK